MKNDAWKKDSEENIPWVKYIPHPDAWESIRWPVAKVIDSRVWKIRWISAESFQTIITVLLVFVPFPPNQEMHKRSLSRLHSPSQVLFEPHLRFYFYYCSAPFPQPASAVHRHPDCCPKNQNLPKSNKFPQISELACGGKSWTVLQTPWETCQW